MNEIRRCFILNLPYANVEHSVAVCIGEGSSQRYTLDKTSKVFLKTTQEKIDTYIAANEGVTFETLFPSAQCDECNADMAAIEMTKPEWQVPMPNPPE